MARAREQTMEKTRSLRFRTTLFVRFCFNNAFILVYYTTEWLLTYYPGSAIVYCPLNTNQGTHALLQRRR